MFGVVNTILLYYLLVPPQISPFDFGDEAINSGDSASVTCSVTKGDLPVNITWLHNNKEILSSLSVTIMRMNRKISTLSIDLAHAEHVGTYTCEVTNAAGSTTHSSFLHVNGTIS